MLLWLSRRKREPEQVKNVSYHPHTIEMKTGAITAPPPEVSVECVENSSPLSGLNPLLRCGAEGRWNVTVLCRCNPGFELDSRQEQCLGIIILYLISSSHVE